jgi:hypothetical protein
VGGWRRVKRNKEKEGMETRKQKRLLEERDGRQACKLSVIKKYFPELNLSPGETWKLQGNLKLAEMLKMRRNDHPKLLFNYKELRKADCIYKKIFPHQVFGKFKFLEAKCEPWK